MKIRKATPDDIEAILKLKLKLKNQDIITDPYLKPLEKAGDIYKKYLIHDIKRQDIDRLVLVAVQDEELIAYIRGNLTKTLHVLNVRLRGVIDNLYVKEKYRGMAVAKRLIEELIAWFKGNLTAHVYPSNAPTIAFYEKFGFKGYSLNMSRKL